MELRVASWNADGWHTMRDKQLRVLDNSGAHVVLLQEVTPASLDRLREAGWRGTSALELVADDHTERRGARPRFGCAVLVRGDVTDVSLSLVAGAPSPVRALMAHLRVQGSTVTAISAALPPGSTWGTRAKVAQADAIARAVADAGAPVVIGMDRNGPKFERWQSAETEWWPEDPEHFIVEEASHGCRDVLDRWYASKNAFLRVWGMSRWHGAVLQARLRCVFPIRWGVETQPVASSPTTSLCPGAFPSAFSRLKKECTRCGLWLQRHMPKSGRQRVRPHLQTSA